MFFPPSSFVWRPGIERPATSFVMLHAGGHVILGDDLLRQRVLEALPIL